MQIVWTLLLVLPILVEGWLFKPKYHTVTITGKFTCGGVPIRNCLVRLVDDDVLFDDTMKSGWTNSNGEFTLTGKGRDAFDTKPDPFAKIEYNYINRMRVKDRLGRTRWNRSSKKKNFSGIYNVGTVNINNEHCRAYLHFRSAIIHYLAQSGNGALPYSSLSVRSNALLTAGTPWATRNSVRLPGGYSLDYDTAKHELAHTVRQTLDGSFGHFLYDVIRFKYAQTHSCNKFTNFGFAFNEGWAEYWEGQCSCVTSGGSDMRYEGNVAACLCKLAACKGHTRMWNVVESYPKQIHSYSSFKSRLYAKYPGVCPGISPC
ncbi:unnamed protein product [Owenia fusiformis]|uniref:Uncharacterized protein n=1 Tax=Owenia fusiformis TaxID=6347 RepID=A0A8J1UMZ2_OWEFU|nr:unnamed protein product [Owenia fusiformis]